MSEAMELSEKALEQIGGYVKQNLPVWIREVDLPPQPLDPMLLERIVRVEDELRLQRELMKQGFEQIDKRFEQVDRRFEQIDKRFESERTWMIKQFDREHATMMEGFARMDERFKSEQAATAKSFAVMDERLASLDRRFAATDRHINRWMAAMMFALTMVVTAATVIAIFVA